MKLDVPRFDGIDSMSCIFNISQFFYYHATIEEERLQVALFYLDDLILRWYQWTTTRCSLGSHSSKHLTCVLLPLSCDDPKGTLFKLTQCGSINNYLADFESLANCIVGLPTSFC